MMSSGSHEKRYSVASWEMQEAVFLELDVSLYESSNLMEMQN